MPSYRKNKHPSIIWDAEYLENRKNFIEKIASKLCNHYGVTSLNVPNELLNPSLTRQDLLHEILTLVLDKTKLKT